MDGPELPEELVHRYGKPRVRSNSCGPSIAGPTGSCPWRHICSRCSLLAIQLPARGPYTVDHDGPELTEELIRRRDGWGLDGAVRVDPFGRIDGPSGFLSRPQACSYPMIFQRSEPLRSLAGEQLVQHWWHRDVPLHRGRLGLRGGGAFRGVSHSDL